MTLEQRVSHKIAEAMVDIANGEIYAPLGVYSELVDKYDIIGLGYYCDAIICK